MKSIEFKRIVLTLVALFVTVTSTSSVINAQSVKLLNTYPSDSTAFTQGLELNSCDELIIGTGLYGESKLGQLNLKNGEIELLDTLEDNFFGEGITHTPDALWQMTWRENTAFKRDLETYEIIDTANYEEEGWGIAYDFDRDIIWHSDGTDTLYKRDSHTFQKIGEINVIENALKVDKLNELEYAEGAIYANIWYDTTIVKIEPDSGEVLARYDVAPLLEEELTEEELEEIDSLNGIAHIEDNRFYITGKLYPYIFEVELVD